MKLSKITFVVLFAISLIHTQTICAQTMDKYKTMKLAKIAEKIGLVQKIDSLDNGLYCGLISFDSHRLSIIKRVGRVEHIGISVFPELIRLSQPSPVYDFIERYALDIMLTNLSTFGTDERLRQDMVTFEKGNLQLLPTFFADTTITIVISNHAERAYAVDWRRGDNLVCRMSFPSNYELLQGSKMLENEIRLKIDIMSHEAQIHKTTLPSIDKLIEDNGLFVFDNGYNSIESMRNCRYFRSIDSGGVDSLELVCSSKFPVESVANLFTGNDIDNNFEVEIRQLKYHFNKENYKVRLSQLIGFCLDEGCLPYFGLISYDESSGEIDAVVEMRNHEESYEHLMRVKMNRNKLDRREGLINVTLTGYILTHDIYDLYNE